MPKPRRTDLWTTRRPSEGFVAGGPNGERTAYAYININSKEWRKSLKWWNFYTVSGKPNLAARKECVGILERLLELQVWQYPPAKVRILSSGEVQVPDYGKSRALRLVELYDIYLKHRKAEYEQGVIVSNEAVQVRQAFRCYFNGAPEFLLTEIEAITDYIRRRTLELDLSDGSKETYLRRLTAMFNYGLHHNLILKNPVPPRRYITLREPGVKDTRAKHRRPFTADELETLFTAARLMDPELEWVFRLYLVTGARGRELTGIRLKESLLREGKTEKDLATIPHAVPGDYLYMRGKGGRFRTLPLVLPDPADRSLLADWQREMWRVVHHLTDLAAERPDGKLIRWNYNTIQWRFYVIRKDNDLSADLDIYALRHTALTYQTNVLGLPKDWLDSTVGNTEEIRKEHYVAPATAEQLRQFLTRHRS